MNDSYNISANIPPHTVCHLKINSLSMVKTTVIRPSLSVFSLSSLPPALHLVSVYDVLIWGEPERAPNTRGAGSGFICIYIFLYVCLWGDHFSEERVKFCTRKVMVVIRMRICPHCTIDLRDNSSVGN